MKKIFLFVCIVYVLFFSQILVADHPTAGFGSGLAGPITTISATTLSKGQWSIGFRTEYLDFRSFSNVELEQFAEQGQKVESTDHLIHPFLVFGYGVSDAFTLTKLPHSLPLPQQYQGSGT